MFETVYISGFFIKKKGGNFWSKGIFFNYDQTFKVVYVQMIIFTTNIYQQLMRQPLVTIEADASPVAAADAVVDESIQ
jgi:hypothetical protein